MQLMRGPLAQAAKAAKSVIATKESAIILRIRDILSRLK